MLPHYNPNYKPLTPWEKFTSWLTEIYPFVVVLCIIGAIFLFVYWLMPRCPECNEIIHPMDVYCSQCGHQLRTK